ALERGSLDELLSIGSDDVRMDAESETLRPSVDAADMSDEGDAAPDLADFVSPLLATDALAWLSSCLCEPNRTASVAHLLATLMAVAPSCRSRIANYLLYHENHGPVLHALFDSASTAVERYSRQIIVQPQLVLKGIRVVSLLRVSHKQWERPCLLQKS